MDKVKRLKEINAELENMYLSLTRTFNPNDISLEESAVLAHIARLTTRLSSVSTKTAIKKGDIILVKWSDGWTYPLVVKQVNLKRISADYIYENGTRDGYTIPFSNVIASFSGSYNDKIKQLNDYIASNEQVANFESDIQAYEQLIVTL
ncbi:hypothetical protein [Yersinia ruckeri]|uniref:hypothetical protein n=1 Tax=Yersinia ruckeri TaxID=29486 RepID=UPI002237FD49|nr:hypothetical protein [Yersinia ruckeri]MCW6598674.1 hypothetical protein [Yersinia ruckeri]